MKHKTTALCVVFAAMLMDGASPVSSANNPEDPELAIALEHLSRVAHLYRDTALKFACREEVNSKGFAAKPFNFYYVYEYDEIGGLRDYRKVPANVPLEQRKRMPPLYLLRAYSWAFLFSESGQARHQYRLVANGTDGEEALGRPAILIQFEPLPPLSDELDQWFGHVWIDAESYQILKVESIHASRLSDYRRFEKEIERAGKTGRATGEMFRFDHYRTEFSVEKNGMRFPEHVVIEGYRYRINRPHLKKKYQADRLFRVDQRYSNYMFFRIRTEEEIVKIVRGN